jgi:hypothetical protein
MKSVNNKVRNVLTVILVIGLLVLSNYSFADTTTRKPLANPVSVKYIGSVNNQDLIQVEIDNSSEDELQITFIDNEGVELYSEYFNSKKITKKFLLDISDFNYNNIQVVVSSRKTSSSQSFAIVKNSTTIDTVVVAKLK